jgi:chloride channel 3/4/5
MAEDEEANEHTHLLGPHVAQLNGHRRRVDEIQAEDAESIISSHSSQDEQQLGHTAIGERLPYNDYTTIDWLHDLVRICRSNLGYKISIAGPSSS